MNAEDWLCSVTMLTFRLAFRVFRPSRNCLRGVRMAKIFASPGSGVTCNCGSGRTITGNLAGNCIYSNDSSCSGRGSGELFQYDEDYHLLMRDSEARFKQLLDSPTRYQPIEKREDRSDIPQSVIESLCLGKYITSYRGALLLREPKELAIFRHFLSCSQPCKNYHRTWNIYRIICRLVC